MPSHCISYIKNRLLILCLFSFPLFCIFPATPSWQLVAGGDSVATPVITDYGFATLLDGRTMAAISSNGSLLWLSSVPGGKPLPFIGKGEGGFLITVGGKNKVSLFNPSGLCLWTREASSQVISAPIQGDDGRIFVQCNDKIDCFGTNGTLKWTIETSAAANIPLLQLEDGSILHIQSKTIGGCSTALRVSPFGKILEEITFTGKIANAKQTDFGVLIIFTDGSIGCCSSTEDGAVSKWVVTSDVLNISSSSSLVVEKGNSLAVVLSPSGSGTSVIFLNMDNGEIVSRQNSPIDSTNLTFSALDADSVMLCDTKKAAGCSVHESSLWQFEIPSSKKWSYVLCLKNGYLVVLEKNSWVISAYRVTQKVGEQRKLKNSIAKKNIYKPFIDMAAKKAGLNNQTSTLFGKVVSDDMILQMEQHLLAGNYADHEDTWVAALSLECMQITNRFMNQSSTQTLNFSQVDEDMVHYQKVLHLIGYLGSSIHNRTLASIIQKETDISLLIAALQTSSQVAYDPDNIILDSLEHLTRRQNIVSNQRVAQELCNAIYEICRFMGKPALFTKGRQLLSYLLNNSTDSKTKIYASLAMEKIIALQM